MLQGLKVGIYWAALMLTFSSLPTLEEEIPPPPPPPAVISFLPTLQNQWFPFISAWLAPNPDGVTASAMQRYQ